MHGMHNMASHTALCCVEVNKYVEHTNIPVFRMTKAVSNPGAILDLDYWPIQVTCPFRLAVAFQKI